MGTFENLETRRLLSVEATTFSVAADDAANLITLSLRESDQRLLASVDGQVVATRRIKGLTLVELSAGGGNDSIAIDLRSAIPDLQFWINGGGGRDRIQGGAGDE